MPDAVPNQDYISSSNIVGFMSHSTHYRSFCRQSSANHLTGAKKTSLPNQSLG